MTEALTVLFAARQAQSESALQRLVGGDAAVLVIGEGWNAPLAGAELREVNLADEGAVQTLVDELTFEERPIVQLVIDPTFDAGSVPPDLLTWQASDFQAMTRPLRRALHVIQALLALMAEHGNAGEVVVLAEQKASLAGALTAGALRALPGALTEDHRFERLNFRLLQDVQDLKPPAPEGD